MEPSRPQPKRRVSRGLAAPPGAGTPEVLTPLLEWPPHIDALIREIHARPDADDARLVLAAAVLAEGDPAGELTALQLPIAAAAAAAPADRSTAGPADRLVDRSQ